MRTKHLAFAGGAEGFLQRQRNAGARYVELRPAPDLAAYVACEWIRVEGLDPSVQELPVVPDGCGDIITCNDGAPFVVGPDTHARWPELPSGAVVIGLRLRPGALRAIVGCSVAELVNISVDLTDLSGAAVRLHSELQDAGTLCERMALLEQWVRQRLSGGKRDLSVIHACRTLAASPSADIADVALAHGWSVRTIHREFVAACGYGPKMMQRILRVQQAIRAAHRNPLQLRDLAAAGEFADQAHMSREFRALTGFTPATYLAHSYPELGRWLDADWALSDSFKTGRSD